MKNILKLGALAIPLLVGSCASEHQQDRSSSLEEKIETASGISDPDSLKKFMELITGIPNEPIDPKTLPRFRTMYSESHEDLVPYGFANMQKISSIAESLGAYVYKNGMFTRPNGNFYMPDKLEFIPESVKKEALRDKLTIYGSAILLMEKGEDNIYRPTEILDMKYTTHPYLFDPKENRQLDEDTLKIEKYMRIIREADIKSIRKIEATTASTKNPRIVGEYDIGLHVNDVIWERKLKKAQ